ncbi:ABC transporter permease [Streptomyces sp. SID5785]|uniref:ABC transporter permease n=1 Tax=Streptomyces sp. SID5785 TaxID=2690309 RepID=UPI001360E338|nr:ABC transporter permease [Streptomyces sp. SID5785]MZD06780.1 ABC transporter permease [Streptomyces sp. SID5785]MZD09673.1 ABC transporter permease [Streptomyces sp. SID5785]
MTLLDDRPAERAPAPVRPGFTGRVRDLRIGVRCAVAGGREGWIRTLLTAIGVGLGVAVLLGAASVPTLMQQRDDRGAARQLGVTATGDSAPRSDRSFLLTDASSEFRDASVGGYLLRPDGAHPVLPPGVDRMPGPGEMVVSPALRRLLDSPDGKLLKERYPYRDVGTIAPAGLSDPFDLYVYAGSDRITADRDGRRYDTWGHRYGTTPMDPVLVVMVILACVVLLVPVAIFIATAVRFGGERRDRRLAALRLVGADVRMTRRMAAGEALFGAVVGVLLGAGFFLAARQLLAHVEVWRLTAFPSDLSPVPVLGALIVVAVPLASIAVTLFALRSVAIEPLGVVRSRRGRSRRLWWRLPIPVIGAALLLMSSATGSTDTFGVVRISAGIGLLLIGLVLVLPWLVEAVVARLHGGSVPWQLATRRLQLSSTAASRAVAGITIAVAGGIALQMFTTAVDDDFVKSTGADTRRAQISANANFPSGALAQRMVNEFGATKGVRKVIGTVDTWASPAGAKPDADGYTSSVTLSVGTCAALRELAHLPSCTDGDVFRVTGSGDAYMESELKKIGGPGTRLEVDGADFDKKAEKAVSWTLPKNTRTVTSRRDPSGDTFGGLLATPSAFDTRVLHNSSTSAQVQVDESVPDALEFVRNTAFRIDPAMRVWTLSSTQQDKQFASIQRGLFTAAAITISLIAASMLINQIEQLRERRRLLSVLVAYGTRRSTLAWSVLWQTAIPVVLGMALAVSGGLALGVLMLRMVDRTVTDWWVFLPLVGVGAAAIAGVTLLSLPPLYRLMRPEGLRTE